MLTNWEAKDIVSVGEFETIANRISVEYITEKEVSHCGVWRNLNFVFQGKLHPLAGVQWFRTTYYPSEKDKEREKLQILERRNLVYIIVNRTSDAVKRRAGVAREDISLSRPKRMR